MKSYPFFYKRGLYFPLYSLVGRTRLAYVLYRQRIQHVDIRNEKLVEIDFWRPDRLGSVQLCLALNNTLVGDNTYKGKLAEEWRGS